MRMYLWHNHAILILDMQRMILVISNNEDETLRRLALEQGVSMAKLIRNAIDAMYGTNDEEIERPGRKPAKRD